MLACEGVVITLAGSPPAATIPGDTLAATSMPVNLDVETTAGEQYAIVVDQLGLLAGTYTLRLAYP